MTRLEQQFYEVLITQSKKQTLAMEDMAQAFNSVAKSLDSLEKAWGKQERNYTLTVCPDCQEFNCECKPHKK